MSSASTPTTPKWLQWIAGNKQQVAYVLFGVAAAFVVLCIYLLWKERQDWLPEAVFSAALAAIALIGAAWYLNREGDTLNQEQAARVLVLAIGALSGLCIELTAIWRTVDWWSWITSSEKWQGPGSWRLVYWLIIAFAGLGLMFVSLMLGRRQEESHPKLRRTIYGYNMAQVIVLTLFLLIVLNVIAFHYVPATSDWTSEGLYTLDETQSQNILKNLQEPVRITVLAEYPGDQLAVEMSKLVDACRIYTNKIKFPITIFYKDKDKTSVARLIRERNLSEDTGVLVDYGDDDPVTKWQFLSRADLFEAQNFQMRQSAPAFKGESALMTALVKLEEDKPAILYFTQGHGELSLSPGGIPTRSASALKKKLEAFYKIRGLNLGPAGKVDDDDTISSSTVPEDASVVIVAGYNRAFAPEEVEALRKYVKGQDRKEPGKLFLLLGDVISPEGKMIDSGLKPLLADLGVELGDNRVMRYTMFEDYDPERPLIAVKPASFESAERKLALGLENFGLTVAKDVRTVKPGAPVPPYHAETLLISPAGAGSSLFTWAETKLTTPPDVLIRDYFTDRDGEPNREKIQQKLRDPEFTQELSIGVTVAEGGGPAMHGMPNTSKPRAVIIGSAQIASDAVQDTTRRGASRDLPYSLLASSLGYLREKPQMIGIPPKEGKYFSLSEKGQQSVAAMRWLPLFFMFFGTLGLGLGIWVVRQR